LPADDDGQRQQEVDATAEKASGEGDGKEVKK